jgi:hypothetical protein
MRNAVLPAVLILGFMPPAVAQPAPGTPPTFGSPVYYGAPGPFVPPRADRAFLRLKSRMIDLRQQAIALQASDGGTLTPEHRDFIQAKINLAYRRYYYSR